VNHNRLFWLYREERLTVRRRGRKRALATRAQWSSCKETVECKK
jgi:hypothetical protein